MCNCSSILKLGIRVPAPLDNGLIKSFIFSLGCRQLLFELLNIGRRRLVLDGHGLELIDLIKLLSTQSRQLAVLQAQALSVPRLIFTCLSVERHLVHHITVLRLPLG